MEKEEIEKRIVELLIMSRKETCANEVRWQKEEIKKLEKKLNNVGNFYNKSK